MVPVREPRSGGTLPDMPTETPTYTTVDGDRVRFLRTSAETGGKLLEMHMAYAPHPKAPPLHLHPVQDEHFEVLKGSVWTRVGGVERTYAAGEAFDIPAGTPHAMRPADGDGAEVIWQVRPALASEAFFRTLWGIDEGEAGRAKRVSKGDSTGGRRSLLRTVAIARAYAPEFRLVMPSFGVQRILFAVLGPIANALGYGVERSA